MTKSINTELIMKHFKIFLFLGILSAITFSLTACSDDSEKSNSKAETTGDHVWKTQTDALQSAKDVTKKMQDNMKQQQKNMEQNN